MSSFESAPIINKKPRKSTRTKAWGPKMSASISYVRNKDFYEKCFKQPNAQHREWDQQMFKIYINNSRTNSASKYNYTIGITRGTSATMHADTSQKLKEMSIEQGGLRRRLKSANQPTKQKTGANDVTFQSHENDSQEMVVTKRYNMCISKKASQDEIIGKSTYSLKRRIQSAATFG